MLHKDTVEFSMNEVFISNARLISSALDTFMRLDEINEISPIQRQLMSQFDELKAALLEARVIIGEG
jgi:hypothetical protein